MEPIEYAEAVEPNTVRQPAPRSFVEQVLSPLMLQRMMACGGGLLVLGFVGWLWSTGIFQQPLVAASAIGIATLSVMGLGMALVRKSRYQLAGTGLTLLAALAMPLNLWFYDAQKLITLANGGHLWIPAAIICAIYALIARTLRKPMFVYTLVGGVVLTGLLFLADQSVNCFWKLMPPVSFLLAVGWFSFFTEQLFPKDDSDFSQAKFGFAFRHAGVGVLCSGLALLLIGQTAGRIGPLLSWSTLPLITTSSVHKLWALGLLLGSAAGFGIDRIVRPSARLSVASAIALMAWAGLTVLDLCSISVQLTHVTIVAGIYTMVAWRYAVPTNDEGSAEKLEVKMLLPFFGLLAMAVFQFAAQLIVKPGHLVFSAPGYMVVLALFVVALVAFEGYQRLGAKPGRGLAFLGASGILSVLASLSIVIAAGSFSYDLFAAAALVPSLAFLALGGLFAKPENVVDWQRSAAASTWFAVVCLLTALIDYNSANFHISAMWISGAMAWILIASNYGRSHSINGWVGYLLLTFSFSQLLCLLGASLDYALILSGTFAGLILSLIGFYIKPVVGAVDASAITSSRQFQDAGNVLVVLGTVCSGLLSANRLLAEETTSALLIVVLVQLATLAAAGWLTESKSWRLAFRAAAMLNVLSGVLVVNSFLTTHWLQRAELGSIVCGIALLVIGHMAWYREGENQDESATAALWSGSVLVAAPLCIGLLFYRSYEINSIWNWWYFHEAAAIIVAFLLLGLGLACRIRSTTIAGTGVATVYMASLLFLIQWPGQLQSVSMLMMVGGGLFFGVAVLLSMYRDRLISLPEDIREGRGMFRVLRWR